MQRAWQRDCFDFGNATARFPGLQMDESSILLLADPIDRVVAAGIDWRTMGTLGYRRRPSSSPSSRLVVPHCEARSRLGNERARDERAAESLQSSCYRRERLAFQRRE